MENNLKTNNMKRTAVEYLIEELNNIKSSSTDQYGKITFLEKEFIRVLDQAKEMKKEQEVYSEEDLETLEEAAEKWFNKDGFYPDPKQGFISGAKWQQERSYSEEDLEKAFKVGFTLGYVGDTLIADKDKCFNRWFKIFKDK